MRLGEPLILSPREYVLLETLIANADRVVPRARLPATAYGWRDDIESNALEVHIHNLRNKLGKHRILTVRGVGYRLVSRPAMSSLRSRLLLLLLVWTTVWIAVALIAWNRSGHEVGELMDAQLAQTAHVLRQITLSGDLPTIAGAPQTLSPIGHPYESMISFQLWREGVLIGSFGAAPPEPLAQQPGFSDQTIGPTRWRVFGLPTGRSGEVLYVAQTDGIRQELIRVPDPPRAAAHPLVAAADGAADLARGDGRTAPPEPACLRHQAAFGRPTGAARRAPRTDRDPTADRGAQRTDASAQAALDTERHFAADASHELRTPFAIIRTHAQIAQRSTDPAERAEALAQLIQGVDRATYLVSQLLTLARLEPDAAEIERGELVAPGDRVAGGGGQAAGRAREVHHAQPCAVRQ